jgi:tight adherence protein B
MADLPLLALSLLILLLVVGGALIVALTGPRAKLRRRVAQVAGKAPAKACADGSIRRSAIQTRLKQMDESRAGKGRSALREQLQMAGLRVEVPHYLAATLTFGAVIAGAAALAGMPPVTIGLAGILCGLGLPKLVVAFLAKRRLRRFTGAFADALDIIVRGIRSGLPLGECITIIGREMPDPLGAEFRLIVEGQRLGLPLEDALTRAVDRMPIPELKYFAIVLTIQQQTGGNLAETLSKLSEVLRARKRMRDKIQAYAGEARASAGIIGSLPIVVATLLAVVAPDYIGLLFSTNVGHLLVLIGFTIMGVGVLVMRQMINFDI